jgi:hypothetical protein
MGILEGTGVLVALDTQRESFSHLYVPPPLEGVRVFVCGEQRDLIYQRIIGRSCERKISYRKKIVVIPQSIYGTVHSILPHNQSLKY